MSDQKLLSPSWKERREFPALLCIIVVWEEGNMSGQNEKGGNDKRQQLKKIKIGRLHVDPVFLLVFCFFTISSFLLALFIWLAS